MKIEACLSNQKPFKFPISIKHTDLAKPKMETTNEFLRRKILGSCEQKEAGDAVVEKE